MTVTIAALCGADNAKQTGSFIMCADTLISYCSPGGVPVSSNPNGSKIYDLPHGFYVAIAADMSRVSQVVSYLYNEMQLFQPSDTRLTDLTKQALEHTSEYVRKWMRNEVLSDYQVSLDEFLHDGQLACRSEITNEITNRVISTQLTVAGFSHTGSPILFLSDCMGQILEGPPFFFCGGAGAGAALDWLNFREQRCSMSVQRTFYHVREAKQFSQVCPVVGDRSNTILLRPGKAMANLSDVKPILNIWSERLFPRKTDCLDNSEAWNLLSENYRIGD